MDCRKYVVVVCGPSDVTKEVGIASEVVDDWNRANSDTRKIMVQCKHWRYDASPDLSSRPQEVINLQIIDSSDIMIAILWSRMGTSTGLFASGTEEEIKRGLTLRKRVMVYFSELEPLPASAESEQLKKLEAFRTRLQPFGLCFSFSSRDQFRRQFLQHLSAVIDDLEKKSKKPEPQPESIAPVRQSQRGRDNVQVGYVGGDFNHYQSPPKIKKVMERRPGGVTPAEALQVHEWIALLAEGDVGMNRSAAFAKWWSIFKNTFKVEKCESLESAQMAEVEAWHRKQRNLQKVGLKTSAPDAWRKDKYKAIKTHMSAMGKDKTIYYLEISSRLKMKRPFASLRDLTKRDLERVYDLVRRDRNEEY